MMMRLMKMMMMMMMITGAFGFPHMASAALNAPRLELQGETWGHDLRVGAERLQVLGLALPLRFATFRGLPGNPECREGCTARYG